MVASTTLLNTTAGVLPQTPLSYIALVRNPSTWEVKVERSEVQGHSQLNRVPQTLYK